MKLKIKGLKNKNSDKSHQKKKKINAPFIGRQLSRFKLGMSYLTLGMSSITAVMTTKYAYDSISIWLILAVLVPIALIGTILLGYFLDKLDITTQDQRKSNEMTHRFLLTSDLKNQEFQLLQTKILLMALQNVKDKKDIDIERLMDEYQIYLDKWKSPEQK
ncbi:MAG: hypothetical protein K9W44_11535 [Candidatus Lokiarchaeota archaeon]|nr:hypothetical protein [Candidatus Harpocratesius repetitus]